MASLSSRPATTNALVPAQPKEKKRRNSEKRKLKSRNAARTRREKETTIFYELAHELPMPHSMCAQLEKAGVMRLLLSYLRIRKFAPKAIKSEPMEVDEDVPLSAEQVIDSYYLKALDGFALMLSQDGDVVFISDNVSQYIGLKQIDLIGQSIYDFSHPCDHEEIREHLSDHPWLSQGGSGKASKCRKEERHSFLIRMKCTLTAKKKLVTLKAATYKVVFCNGILKVAPSVVTSSGYRLPQMSCLSLIAMPIHHPANIEIPMDKQTFLTRHSMDMKFTYCDDRIKELLGYDADDLVDQSFYEFYHALDSHTIERFHKDLFAKGQATSGHYRFLAKKSGFAWMETQSTVIYSKTNKPQCVVSINYLISGIEGEDTVISTHQLDEAIQMSTEMTFMPRPQDMDDDDFPLYLTGSKSNVGNPEDLTYLAPMASSAMVPLDTEQVQPVQKEGCRHAFAPFFPLMPLDTGEDVNDTQEEPDCISQGSSPRTATPDLVLPDKNSLMSSSKDPLLLDCSTERGGRLQSEDLSMRAPYISMNDDFDLGGDKLLVDTKLPETWDMFGNNMNNPTYTDPMVSPAFRDPKQELLSPTSGSLTPSSSPYSPQSMTRYSPQSMASYSSQSVSSPYSSQSMTAYSPSPLTPVNKLCRSLPNLWLMSDPPNDDIASSTPKQQQQQQQYYFESSQSPPPLLPISPPVRSPIGSPPQSQAPKEADRRYDPGRELPRPDIKQALKRKLHARGEKVADPYKVARLDKRETKGGGGINPVDRDKGGWNTSKGGPELDALKPPGGGEKMSSLQSLLFRSDGRSINNHFGHSMFLQKIAQQMASQQAGSKSDVSNALLQPAGGSGGRVQFPLFQTQPSPGDNEEGPGSSLLNCLPMITRHDLDVNTPLQASAGLLQGEDLLRALDVP